VDRRAAASKVRVDLHEDFTMGNPPDGTGLNPRSLSTSRASHRSRAFRFRCGGYCAVISGQNPTRQSWHVHPTGLRAEHNFSAS
jgi:hypothetical protein